MNITVYLGSGMGKEPYYEAAVRELGIWIGKAGHTLVYGGSKVGLMGILAESVLQAGGKVTGVEPDFFVKSALQHEGITELIVTKDMYDRKKKMMELGDAFIAFPGGTGTLEEISEVMSHNNIGLIAKPCIVYNLNHYYDSLEALLDHMAREEFLPESNRARTFFARNLDEITGYLYQRTPAQTAAD